jgi:hypothetical protein
LCRDNDVASPRLVDRKRITFNAPVDVAEGGLLIRRRASRDGKSRTFGEVRDSDGNRARPANDDLGSRQDGLHENIHRAFVRAHVLGKAHPTLLFAGRMALLIEQVRRLH